jgi:RHS repeat-associated protein
MNRVPLLLFLLALLGASPIASAQSTDTVIYYHADAIGSVRMITDANQQVVARYDYWPFGEEVVPAAPVRDPRLFAGKERDTQTGFDYFGARYYGNQTARFITVDPVLNIEEALVDPQRWNRYAYARDNPLRYTDPTGLYICNGSEQDCTQVDAYVGSLRDSLRGLDPKSDGYQKVARTLAYFGARNVKNGVVFEPTTLDQGVLGKAGPGGLIQLDLAQITAQAVTYQQFNRELVGSAFGAANIAHEGRHKLDAQQFGDPMSRRGILRTELNAYATDSYVFEGLRINGPTWMSIWSPALREQIIHTFAERSAQVWCLNNPACR